MHVPLQLERHERVFTHVRCRSFLSVRLKHVSQSLLRTKKKKTWNKKSARPRFEPPTIHRKSLTFQQSHEELDDFFGRSKSPEGRRRRTTARHRALWTHFSPQTITPTLSWTLLKYPYPNPYPNLAEKPKHFDNFLASVRHFQSPE